MAPSTREEKRQKLKTEVDYLVAPCIREEKGQKLKTDVDYLVVGSVFQPWKLQDTDARRS